MLGENRAYKQSNVPEEAMDRASSEIEKHLATIGEIQREMGEVTLGNSILLVDPSFDYAARFLSDQQQEAAESGLSPLFELYLQKLFGGNLPNSAGDIFRSFFGPNIPIAHLNLRRRTLDNPGKKVGAVMFAGSPANVSSAFHPEERLAGVSARERETHLDVYKFASAIYRQAADLNLPVMGICYGHQLVSKERGGQVVRNIGERAGFFPVEEAGEYGRSMLMAVSGRGLEVKKGMINTHHGDVVIPNPEASALLLHSTDQNPHVVQGLLHICAEEGKKFSGNAPTDAELVKELMGQGEHVALTIQSHPESTGYARWATFSRTEDLSSFTEPIEEILSGKLLKIFLEFLKRHGQKQ